MAWSLLDSGPAGFSDGGSGHAFAFPGGAAGAGDLLILSVSSDTTVSTPAGWVAAVSDVGNIGAYMFYVVAAGGESSVTINTSGNFATAIGFLRYAGAQAAPLDVTAAARSIVSGSASPAVTTAGLAQTGEASIAAACLGGLQNASQTNPVWSVGYASRISAQSAGTGTTDQHLFVADNTNAGTAAQSPSVSWTGATNNQTILVATFIPSLVPVQQIHAVSKVMGWDLYSTLVSQTEYKIYYDNTLPLACPRDGTPLKEGPQSRPGVLYCPNGDFIYPDDWDRDSMSGM